MSTANPTPEYFDPLEPHIGFSGSDFDPPNASVGYSPTIRAAGEALAEGQEQTSLGVLESMVVEIINDLTGVDLTDLFETVGGLIDSGIATVTRIVDDIVGIFNGLVVTPINNLVQGIKDWWSGLWEPGKGGALERQKDAIDFTAEETRAAMTKAQAAATLAAAAEGQGIALDKELAGLIPAVATKATHDEVPKDVPGWNSLNPLEDVSFPRTDLVQIPTIVNGKTSSDTHNALSGHNHNHNAQITWVDPTYQQPWNRSDFTFVNCTRKRVYNTIGFAVGPAPSAPPNSFVVSLWKMDATDGIPNGNLTRLWTSGSLTPIFPVGSQDIRIDFPDVEAAPGDWFAVQIRQPGNDSIESVRPVFCKTVARIAAQAGVNPSRLSMTVTGLYSGATFIPKADLDTTSVIIPWVALGQKARQSPASGVDLFDRDDIDGIGPNWGTSGIGIVVRGRMAQSRQVDYGWNDSRENYTTATWLNPTVTKSQSVSAKLGAWPNYDINNAVRDKPYNSMVWLRGNSTLTRGVAAVIYQNKVEIRGFNAAHPRSENAWEIGGVTMAEIPHQFTGNATWFLHAAGKGYTLYKNGETTAHAILTFPDDLDEFVTGPNDKYGGMTVYAYSHGNLVGAWHGQYVSAPIDEWKMRDLT